MEGRGDKTNGRRMTETHKTVGLIDCVTVTSRDVQICRFVTW